MKSLPFGLSELSVAERVELVEDLWDSIADSPENLPITEAQRTELDRRLRSHEAEPDLGASWADVRERLARKRPK
jgi:putative addiction module component (TIGR02574 family)